MSKNRQKNKAYKSRKGQNKKFGKNRRNNFRGAPHRQVEEELTPIRYGGTLRVPRAPKGWVYEWKTRTLINGEQSRQWHKTRVLKWIPVLYPEIEKQIAQDDENYVLETEGEAQHVVSGSMILMKLPENIHRRIEMGYELEQMNDIDAIQNELEEDYTFVNRGDHYYESKDDDNRAEIASYFKKNSERYSRYRSRALKGK